MHTAAINAYRRLKSRPRTHEEGHIYGVHAHLASTTNNLNGYRLTWRTMLRGTTHHKYQYCSACQDKGDLHSSAVKQYPQCSNLA